MRPILNFCLLLVKSVLFIWVIAFVIVLTLFLVGHEADGLTTGEKITTAVLYGFYVGAMFGSLLAIYISVRDWNTDRKNRKILARKASLENSGNPDKTTI